MASFTAGLPDNVGVGDAIEYDCDGDNEGIGNLDASDCVIFISGRTDSQTYAVQDAAGNVPADLAVADNDWQIFRAYTSLSDAESGTVNSSIDADLQSQVTGGDHNLVVNNEQWNIALYADGDDTTGVKVAGWTTSATNYLKIYTPYLPTEVGVSQRHDGTY